MSCIPTIGRKDAARATSGPAVPQSSPPWTKSKQRRIDEFARSDDASQRAIAAAHPKCQKQWLMWLLQDENLHVRRMAVQNRVMTRAMFRLALNDEDPGIRAYVRMVLGSKTGRDNAKA